MIAEYLPLGAGVLLFLGLVAAILRWRETTARRITDSPISAETKLELEISLSTGIATLVGGLAVIIGLLLTSTQILDARRSAAAQLITERMAKGFELLAAEPSQRVGGVYVLSDVAQREPRYARAIYEALVDHVRGQPATGCLGEHPPECKRDVGLRPEDPCVSRPLRGDVQAAISVLSGKDAALSGATIDLTGSGLSGARLFNANLKGAKLARADLSGAYLAGANISDYTDLYCANLQGAELYGVEAKKANLAGARLLRSYLGPARRAGSDEPLASNLAEAELSGSDLRKSRLCDAQFAKGMLRGALLDDVEAYYSNFSGADLSRASFTNALLSGANFIGAKVNTVPLIPGSTGKPVFKLDLTCAVLGRVRPREYCGNRIARRERVTLEPAQVGDDLLREAILCHTVGPDGRILSTSCPDDTGWPCTWLKEDVGLVRRGERWEVAGS